MCRKEGCGELLSLRETDMPETTGNERDQTQTQPDKRFPKGTIQVSDCWPARCTSAHALLAPVLAVKWLLCSGSASNSSSALRMGTFHKEVGTAACRPNCAGLPHACQALACRHGRVHFTIWDASAPGKHNVLARIRGVC